LEITHLIFLGFVQGLTEFLPISSSAHLILVPVLFEWIDQGLVHDIAAHVGTLCAVVFYFRKDLKKMLTDWSRSGFSTRSHEGRYVWFIIAATIPVAVVGLAMHSYVDTYLRNPMVIAAATIFFAFILWWADVVGKRVRDQTALGWRDVMIIGFAQVLALVPGTSRAGITMTAGLFLGLTRETAARFSFLLAIPTIALAGGYETLQLVLTDAPVPVTSILVVTAVSAVTAGVTIHFFLRFLEKTRMLPYVIYRLLLGAFLFYLFF
jgi:undecaprenyl-diphosphatase